MGDRDFTVDYCCKGAGIFFTSIPLPPSLPLPLSRAPYEATMQCAAPCCEEEAEEEVERNVDQEKDEGGVDRGCIPLLGLRV